MKAAFSQKPEKLAWLACAAQRFAKDAQGERACVLTPKPKKKKHIVRTLLSKFAMLKISILASQKMCAKPVQMSD